MKTENENKPDEQNSFSSSNCYDEELKSIAKRLANLSHIPYAWEDFLNRIKNGIRLPVTFNHND